MHTQLTDMPSIVYETRYTHNRMTAKGLVTDMLITPLMMKPMPTSPPQVLVTEKTTMSRNTTISRHCTMYRLIVVK